MNEKKRLDAAVFEKGLVQSRERAKAMIMAGQVYVNSQKALKAGMPVKDEDIIEVRDNANPFVSRGGLKLQKGVDRFGLKLDDCICMDIGASTGGFTDCMLMHGAKKVYSIDVGYGQLAWKLRTDERVINMERTNFRYVTPEKIPDEIDFASVDVSFISLKLILPVMYELLRDGGESICLIKPQFEAGRENVGKKGVVRDKSIHTMVVRNICKMAMQNGFKIKNLDFSPVKGPEGNIEYLMYITKSDKSIEEKINMDYDFSALVERSHIELCGG